MDTTNATTTATAGAEDAPASRYAIKGFGTPSLRWRVWWIRYYLRGREYRTTSHSEREADAGRMLREEYKKIARGRFVRGPRRSTALHD